MKKRGWLNVLIALATSALFAGWWRRQQPRILRIPVAPRDEAQAGQLLLVQGERFGSRQGASRLERRNADGSWSPLEILSWSEARIIARLPEAGTPASGVVRVRRAALPGFRLSEPHGYTTLGAQLPSLPYGYQAPVQASSPWPTFRRDHRNSGRSPIQAQYHGDHPWTFATAKGIFSTPVIDAQGCIYIGSADHTFYALHPDGRVKWKYETGEVIDSAAALGEETVTFISGDGFMYQARREDGEILWKFEAPLQPGVSFNRWFEGNVAVGFDGTLYAGNTNFHYYAVNPDGSLKWSYPTGSNAWSQAAFGDDGSIYWGSCDTHVHAVTPQGKPRWKRRTLGFIAASAAIGSDGSIYIGSFDSNLYCLEPRRGRVKWRFATLDHIYASVALGADNRGETRTIYLASTDGYLYALEPADGALRWKFYAGDPIRSSPAVGLAPEGGEIVYFGCGDGCLYAINGIDGSLRWRYDTTPDEPELRDRNDLNGSPALGGRGIVIGGEHGLVCYIPYDYPLHCPEDGRGLAGSPSQVKPSPRSVQNGAQTRLCYVTPGGSTLPEFPAALGPEALITLRLSVQRYGEHLPARLQAGVAGRRNVQVSFEPPIKAQVEVSADGSYLHIRPLDFLTPGSQYSLSVKARYYTSGLRLGNLTLSGQLEGELSEKFHFYVEEPTAQYFPLIIGPQRSGAIEWTRLAAALPTMLPSLNQIGFDYLDWIIAPVYHGPERAGGRSRLVLWAVGARRDAQGVLRADPHSELLLPLSGECLGEAFIISNEDFHLPITGIEIPFRLFELRGRLGMDGIVLPGASTYAETRVLDIPNFGWKIALAGLANNLAEKLVVCGTFITRPYPEHSPSNQRPEGVSVSEVLFQPPSSRKDGRVQAQFSLDPGASLPVGERRACIALVDTVHERALSLDYAHLHTVEQDASGNLSRLTLRLPRGTHLPERLHAIVILDVYPLHSQALTWEESP